MSQACASGCHRGCASDVIVLAQALSGGLSATRRKNHPPPPWSKKTCRQKPSCFLLPSAILGVRLHLWTRLEDSVTLDGYGEEHSNRVSRRVLSCDGARNPARIYFLVRWGSAAVLTTVGEAYAREDLVAGACLGADVSTQSPAEAA